MNSQLSSQASENTLALKQKLKILSYNIQTGLPSSGLSNYLTTSWRHLVPHESRAENLEQIAAFICEFDIVALQEVDPGSLRSGLVNQAEFLAKHANFPFWYLQVNREFGKFAKHSNAVLSRFPAFDSSNHKLPGIIPGRGAIQLLFGDPANPLVCVIMHLALGPVARKQQLKYVADLITNYQHVIVMGDMNCTLKQLSQSSLLLDHKLRPANYLYNTYPSWRPRKNIDHILVSPSIKVEHVDVLNIPYSDHLPIALELSLL